MKHSDGSIWLHSHGELVAICESYGMVMVMVIVMAIGKLVIVALQ